MSTSQKKSDSFQVSYNMLELIVKCEKPLLSGKMNFANHLKSVYTHAYALTKDILWEIVVIILNPL